MLRPKEDGSGLAVLLQSTDEKVDEQVDETEVLDDSAETLCFSFTTSSGFFSCNKGHLVQELALKTTYGKQLSFCILTMFFCITILGSIPWLPL